MIEKLVYLVALAREKNFRRAAEACGVAQPTLSAGIRQLEDELGAMLVRRSSRMQGLTPEGEAVLVWARRMTGDAQAMRAELRTRRVGLAGPVRIAVIPTALAMVPVLTEACIGRHPGLRFSIVSCSAEQVLGMLENMEVDAGITYLDADSMGPGRSALLYRERYLLMTADAGLFAGRDGVGWGELGGVALCLLSDDMQNRRIMDRLMEQAGVRAETAVESNSQITLIAHVLSGRWATILPESIASVLGLSSRLRCIAVGEGTGLGPAVGLVLPDRAPLPLLGAALLAEARALGEGAGVE